MLATTLLCVAYYTYIRRKIAFAVNLAFEYPNLDTYFTIDSLRFRDRIIDIRAKGMQRNTTFLVLFSSRHISASQPSRYLYFYSFSTNPHGRCDSLLHRTLIGDTCLNLLCN